jgi:23S rRNA pseudouridine1911/1915/1917 synthase
LISATSRRIRQTIMAIVEVHREVTGGPVARIDRVVQELTARSRADVRGLFDHDCVQLNDELCSEPGTPLKNGDRVSVRHDPHTRYREKPRQRENAAFRLVFEDEELLVVDKAAAVLTVPSDRGEKNTLLDAVSHYLNRRGHRGRATVVQRLDRGTSGLLVLAKTPLAVRELRSQLRGHTVEREYTAIVAGHIVRDKGTFASRLGTTKSLQRYSIRDGEDAADEEGETAVTHYHVEERLPELTCVRVQLETGRRNQIRVHFAEAGHPVLGDERYRTDLARHLAWTVNRLALHAAVLGFEHPRTHEWLKFESPLPVDFEKFLARVRKHG